MDLRPVETLAMHEQIMFAQALAMVGCDNDQCSIEDATTLQVVEQRAELFIQIGQAIIISIASQVQVALGQALLVQEAPSHQDVPEILLGFRVHAEPVPGPWGDQVRRVRIEVIEEHEEGTPRLATLAEPVQKIAIDLLSSLAVGGEEPIVRGL